MCENVLSCELGGSGRPCGVGVSLRRNPEPGSVPLGPRDEPWNRLTTLENRSSSTGGPRKTGHRRDGYKWTDDTHGHVQGQKSVDESTGRDRTRGRGRWDTNLSASRTKIYRFVSSLGTEDKEREDVYVLEDPSPRTRGPTPSSGSPTPVDRTGLGDEGGVLGFSGVGPGRCRPQTPLLVPES